MGNICFKNNNARKINIPNLILDKSELDKYKILNYINKGAYGEVYDKKQK